MIGEDSTTWRPPSGSARTGQLPVFSHSATAGLAHSGGSVIEMNCPPETVTITCAATSAVGSASSLSRGCAGRTVGSKRRGPVLDPELEPDRPPRARYRRGAHTDTAPARDARRRTA